jgi:hypothetical protein
MSLQKCAERTLLPRWLRARDGFLEQFYELRMGEYYPSIVPMTKHDRASPWPMSFFI